jgi:hypothetical protein
MNRISSLLALALVTIASLATVGCSGGDGQDPSSDPAAEPSAAASDGPTAASRSALSVSGGIARCRWVKKYGKFCPESVGPDGVECRPAIGNWHWEKICRGGGAVSSASGGLPGSDEAQQLPGAPSESEEAPAAE